MSKPTILSTIEKKAVLDASDILLLLGECMGEEELRGEVSRSHVVYNLK